MVNLKEYIVSKDLDRYRRLARAKEFIDRHYMKPICLSEISKNSFFSTYHFIRLFKKAFHTTPHQYLIRKRIEMAKKLASTDNLSITEICYNVGFESPGSFSLLFKKHTGYSPLEYKLKSIAKQKAGEQNPQILVPGCFVYMYITQSKKSNFQ
jgi:AraC-like DNA-binding protein